MKVANLEGEFLDDLVAGAEGDMGPSRTPYSEDWALAGPIIEHEKIDLQFSGVWMAEIMELRGNVNYVKASAYGPTPLIAAMRCYVSSVYGEEVP
jgi:hypothetical protein